MQFDREDEDAPILHPRTSNADQGAQNSAEEELQKAPYAPPSRRAGRGCGRISAVMWGSKEGGGCMDARECSEYDVNEAKKAIKGAFGDGVMASHQLGALLWPTTALYYAKCYLCKSRQKQITHFNPMTPACASAPRQ